MQSLFLLFKLAIFLLKMLSITKPCSPLATREAVWWPVMGLAALELAVGNTLGLRITAGLAGIHVLALAAVVRFGGGFCVRNWTWDDV